MVFLRIKYLTLLAVFILLTAFSMQGLSQEPIDQLLLDQPAEVSPEVPPDIPALPAQTAESVPVPLQVPPDIPALPAQTVESAPVPLIQVPPDIPVPAVQMPQEIPAAQQDQEEPKKKKRFMLFKSSPLKEQQKEERKQLREKHKQELKDLKEQERQEGERLKEKHGKIEEVQVKARSENWREIRKRKIEIKKAKKAKRQVEVTTNESDPLFIKEAEVRNAKTKFLEIHDIDFNYRLVLKNQTPKIINFVLVIWEKKIMFNGGESAIKKVVRISKPITPYEEKVIEFAELDSKREGETYSVKIAKVIFEDKTEWKNSLVSDEEKD